jgi:hypothetical protein
VRYFFYGGPLGVQAEVSRHGLGPKGYRSIQFNPAVIYRFVEQQFDAPVSLTPYAGAGLSFVTTSFGDDDPLFDALDGDDTSVGVLLFGGVELFFERIPNLGASGELRYTSNDDVTPPFGFGEFSRGGVSFVASAHWYFW